MFRVVKYVAYEGASNTDFDTLEEATTYFEKCQAQSHFMKDDFYKVELMEVSMLATAIASK